MPNPAPSSPQLSDLQSLAEHKLNQVIKKFPAYQTLGEDKSGLSLPKQSADPTLDQELVNPDTTPQFSAVLSDEVKELFIKLRSVVTNHQLWQDTQMRLFLEQHISDLIGFTVSSELEKTLLPVWHGRVSGLSHQKRSISDTLAQHRSHLEAGLSPYRIKSALSSDEMIGAEQYGVQYPAWLLSGYQASAEATIAKLRRHKWLIINPMHERIVVGDTLGVMSPSHRYGLGLTPELMRLGRFWWPGQTGDALCLLVDRNCSSGLLYG